MVKRLMLILVAALIVGLAVPAFAEVQNIKVSGDITARYIERAQMDFQSGEAGGSNDAQIGDNRYDDVMSHFLSTVRLRVDADLTDNVSAVVRLINERVWGELSESNDSGATAGSSGFAQDALIELDLAYMTLKEFLYSPLTLIIGRQPLRYGSGFIVGDPDTNQFSEYNHYSGTQVDTIVPEDLASLKAFDAIRAILDYNPMVIDLIWAKIDEAVVLGTTGTPEHDDVDLYGVNVAYDWGGDKNIQTESYMFWKEVSSDGGTGNAGWSAASVTVAPEENNDRTITLGGRATLEPIERLFVSGEAAFQMGKKFIATDSRDREAFAYQLVGQYALDMKYDPIVTVAWTHWTGDKDPASSEQGKRSFNLWDPMFEDQGTGKLYNALFPANNQKVIALDIGVTPMDDVNLTLSWAKLILDEAFSRAGAGQPNITTWTPNDYGTYTVNVGKYDVGQEVDLALTYDYTEDVQFGLNAGVFMPGAVFTTIDVGNSNEISHENAYQVIGSVAVAF